MGRALIAAAAVALMVAITMAPTIWTGIEPSQALVAVLDFGARWSNFLIMIFTLALTAVAIAQHRLAERMSAETSTAIEYSRQSAEAARLTAELSDRSLQSSQRAYICMMSWQHGFARDSHLRNDDGTATHGDFSVFVAQYFNHGNTPARDVEIYIKEFVLPLGEQPSPDVSRTIGGSAIGPKTPFASSERGVPLETCVAAFNRQCDIFVFTRVDYRDVFSSEPRTTQVCSRVDFMQNPLDWKNVEPEARRLSFEMLPAFSILT